MKRYTPISWVWFLLVFGFGTCASANAAGREYTPPSNSDYNNPSTGTPEDYAFVKNADGTYTEWYDPNMAGTSTGEAVKDSTRGPTFSGEAMAEGDRIDAGAAVDAGTTGQDASIVEGATSAEEGGSSTFIGYLQRGLIYKTSGEAAIGDSVAGEAIADGALPTIGEMLGSAAGAVFSGGAILAAGVSLGDGIDAVIGEPYINPFAGTDKGPKEGEGLVTELEQEWEWSNQVELGEVRECKEFPGYGENYSPYPNPNTGKLELRPNELCEYPKRFYRWSAEYKYAGTPMFQEEVMVADSVSGEESLHYFHPSFWPCPSGGAIWVTCGTHEVSPGESNRALYAPLFEIPNDTNFRGFPGKEMGANNGSKTGTLSPMPAIEPLVPPTPNEVPPVVRHKIREATTTKPSKEEEEEGIRPVPLIPDIEPGVGPGELPNPANPVVPRYSPNELGETYQAEVEAAGFPEVTVEPVPEAQEDPSVGPKDVVTVNPGEGTRADPSTKIKIGVNPDTAPTPGPEGGGSIGPPTEPGLEFPKFGVLCKGFPFGVPCWLAKTVESWSASPVTPQLGIASFTIMGHTIPGSKLDLAKLEPIMEKVRPAMLIFATIGLVLLFYNFAKGGSPPSGSSGDSDSSQESGGSEGL